MIPKLNTRKELNACVKYAFVQTDSTQIYIKSLLRRDKLSNLNFLVFFFNWNKLSYTE